MRRKLIPYTMPDGRRPAGRFSVILSAVLAVAVVVLGGLNVYQYSAMKELSERSSSVERQAPAQIPVAVPTNADPSSSPQYQAMITVLKTVAPSIEYKLHLEDVYASNAYIVSHDGTNLYHRYECPYYDHSNEFMILSTNYAESLGYHPCPKCVASDSEVFLESYAHYRAISDLIDLIYNGTESDWMTLGASLQSSDSQGA